MKTLLKLVVGVVVVFLFLGVVMKMQEKITGKPAVKEKPPVSITRMMEQKQSVAEIVDELNLEKKAWRWVTDDLRRQRRYNNSSQIRPVQTKLYKTPIMCDSCKSVKEPKGHSGYTAVEYIENMGTNAFGAKVTNKVRVLVFLMIKGNLSICQSGHGIHTSTNKLTTLKPRWGNSAGFFIGEIV